MPNTDQQPEPTTGMIVVSGTGRVSVEPDLADLRLGVSVARPTVDAARAEAATTMDAILAAVTEAGVARRDVRTTLLSVQPRYDYRDNKPPALTGYELANIVEVTVRDLDRLGESWTARFAPGRRAWTACRSGSRTRPRRNAKRASSRWPPLVAGRTCWRRPRA